MIEAIILVVFPLCMAFAAISDPAERSRAIFAEAAKVLTHPRCMNCHPATDRVLQGDDKHPHQPVATRQTPCVTCHTDRNFTLHSRLRFVVCDDEGRTHEMAWLRAITERKGRFKIYSTQD